MVSELTATIDGRTVETKIKQKEEAKEIYDDAVASGNTAVMAARDEKKEESMTIALGNLPVGQDAQIKIKLLQEVDVDGSACNYQIPIASFPDYNKHPVVPRNGL